MGVINYITDSKLEFNEKEDKLDMCKGLDEFAARAKAEGKAEGALEQEKKNIKTMHKNGFAPEVIAKALSLNINYVPLLTSDAYYLIRVKTLFNRTAFSNVHNNG